MFVCFVMMRRKVHFLLSLPTTSTVAADAGRSSVSSISVCSLMPIVKPITGVLIGCGGPIGMKNCPKRGDLAECQLGADEELG